MSRGRHAAPKKHGPAVAAARTAIVRTGACAVGLGLGWTLVTAVVGQGYLDAFAAENQASTGAAIGAADSCASCVNSAPLHRAPCGDGRRETTFGTGSMQAGRWEVKHGPWVAAHRPPGSGEARRSVTFEMR